MLATARHTFVDAGRLAEIARLVDAGHLVPLVARTLPLDRAAEALRAGAGPHEPARSSYGSATDRPVTTLRSFGDHPK
jgi:hypothetical protein